MKRKWVLLKILLFFIALVGLSFFANNLYKQRDLVSIDNNIDYAGGNYFITHKVVEDVLKSTHIDYPKMQAQRVSVKNMENKLMENPFVESAQVFLDNKGVLHTKIKQKNPIVRVHNGKNQYYITSLAEKIPLSPLFSSPVLLAEGKIDSADFKGMVNLSQTINEDNLLKNLIIGIRKNQQNSFILLVANGSYVLDLGNLDDIEQKLTNFKIFYQEYIEKSAEMPYKKLSLKYNNQIVASK